jgi:hypothetical protein
MSVWLAALALALSGPLTLPRRESGAVKSFIPKAASLPWSERCAADLQADDPDAIGYRIESGDLVQTKASPF